MYPPLTIANYFVQKSLDTGVKLTPLKLVKLVYIAHGWYYALSNKALINEGVFAWAYGPVIESVYHKFKKHGKNQIPSQEYDPLTSMVSIDDEDKQFLDKVWQVYQNYNGLQLSTLTHMVDTPWHEIFYSKGQDHIIPNELIAEHYRAKTNQ